MWEPNLVEPLDNNLFVHFYLFTDGFRTGSSGQSCLGLLISLVEFSSHQKWASFSENTAGICPMAFINKSKVSEKGLNYYLECFTQSFVNCSKGIDLYIEAAKCTKRVFAIISVIGGDLPGRSELCGFKELCYVCNTKSLHSFFDETIVVRSNEEIIRIGEVLGKGVTKSYEQQRIGLQERANTYSGTIQIY